MPTSTIHAVQKSSGITPAIRGGELRILDIDLAGRLGFDRPRNIRNLIKRYEGDLSKMGVCFTVEQTSGGKGGRPAVAYYLNEEQALFITTKSETPNAIAVTIEIVTQFAAFKREGRPQPKHEITPTGLLAERVDKLETLITETVAPLLKTVRVTHEAGTSAVTDRTAKEWLEQYGCDPHGRGSLVRKVGNALRGIAKREGVPLLECARTGTDLFPHTLAVPFMESAGKAWVRLHNEAVRTGQLVLPGPGITKLARGIGPFGRGDAGGRMSEAEISDAVIFISQAFPEHRARYGTTIEQGRSRLRAAARAIMQLWRDLEREGQKALVEV